MGSSQAARVEYIKRTDEVQRQAAVESLRTSSFFEKLVELQAAIEGEVILPSDEEKYNNARNRVFVQDLKGFPLVVTRPKHTQDVSNIVKFVRANIPADVNLCVACGCHSSQAFVNDSFVIDLVFINQTEFVESTGAIHVGGGAYLKAIDETLAPYNRAVPVGTYPETGVGGLSLGGGFGWLTRMYGLTVDNFLETEVVLYDGTVVIANASNEYSDLFWGLRGGGGNFGIVTRFTFQTHQLPKYCIGGFVVSLAPFQKMAKDIVLRADHLMKDCPRNLCSAIGLPGGKPVVVTVWNYFGDTDQIRDIPVLNQADKMGGIINVQNSVKKCSFHNVVQHFTVPMNPQGAFSYHTLVPFGNFEQDLPEEFVDSLVAYTRKSLPKEVYDATMLFIPVSHPDLVNADVDNVHTAISQEIRRTRYFALIEAHYKPELSPLAKDKAKAWVKEAAKILQPLKSQNLYAPDSINKVENKEFDNLFTNIVGYNLTLAERLGRLKRKYDPENFFHMNPNIKPIN